MTGWIFFLLPKSAKMPLIPLFLFTLYIQSACTISAFVLLQMLPNIYFLIFFTNIWNFYPDITEYRDFMKYPGWFIFPVEPNRFFSLEIIGFYQAILPANIGYPAYICLACNSQQNLFQGIRASMDLGLLNITVYHTTGIYIVNLDHFFSPPPLLDSFFFPN